MAVAAALAAFAAGLRWGTFAAGGSDSSCYLNEARLLSTGTTHIEEPLIDRAPWPRAEWTFTPAGHMPSPAKKDLIVPICPPGLPLLMAAVQVIHVSPLIIVPLCGALAVWLTFVLGRRLGDPIAGSGAAVLLACSPVFLFQIVQPMTDVPAAAWWLLVAALAIGETDARSRPLAAGLAASLAILTRPNLLPLAAIVVVFVAASSRRAVVRFISGVVPGVVLLALLQRAMYGSPFATGYGPTGELFHARNVLPNLVRYSRWLWDTHTPILALAVAAPFVSRRRGGALLCLLLAAATALAYLPYSVFDAWWYLRFLLPALALLIVLTMSAISSIAERLLPRLRMIAVALIVIGLAVSWASVARARGAFDLQRMERPFIDAGSFVAERLADRTAIVTIRYSGAVHYYARRPIVSWDTLEPGTLDRALAFLRAQGLRPILLLDTSEELDFRARFGRNSLAGQLDWPPMARLGRTTRVYDPDDRARYLAGARIQTIER